MWLRVVAEKGRAPDSSGSDSDTGVGGGSSGGTGGGGSSKSDGSRPSYNPDPEEKEESDRVTRNAFIPNCSADAMFCGDSLSLGPYGDAVKQLIGGPNYDISRQGEVGATLEKVLANMRRQISIEGGPSVAVVMAGTNDFWRKEIALSEESKAMLADPRILAWFWFPPSSGLYGVDGAMAKQGKAAYDNFGAFAKKYLAPLAARSYVFPRPDWKVVHPDADTVKKFAPKLVEALNSATDPNAVIRRMVINPTLNPDVLKWVPVIEGVFKTDAIDYLPAVLSIMHLESGGNSGAVSSAGAAGLMQFMPATARSLGFSEADRFDPTKNLQMTHKMWRGERYKVINPLDTARLYYHHNRGGGATGPPSPKLSLFCAAAQRLSAVYARHVGRAWR